MKFIFLWLYIFFASTNINFSQTHRFYLSAGYNIPTTTSTIDYNDSNNSFQQNISTYSEGIVYQGGYQFVINNNLLLDLNINYLPGYTDEKYYTKPEVYYYGYTNSSISVSPSLNIKFDVGNFSPYTKFGFSINSIRLSKELRTSPVGNVGYDLVYKGVYSLGFLGGIGIDYFFAKTFIGFVEAQLNSFTYYPNELEITQYFSSGNKKTTIYQLKENNDEKINNENIMPLQNIPFSSIGIIIGLRIVL